MNLLNYLPPTNSNSRKTLQKLWYEKVKFKKDLYRTKNAIFISIIKINNLLNCVLNEYINNKSDYSSSDMHNDTDENIIDTNNKQENKKGNIKISKNMTIIFEKSVTLNYNVQLKESSYINEEEIEDINIVYKNKKIKYCSIDLLLKKICEDNSLNIQIYINSEKEQSFNFINAFIFQCFGFISYETIINKLLALHKYYKFNNTLTSIINQRILKLIFKFTKYLLDHERYKCSYFKYSDDLTNKLKIFLNENNMKDQIERLLDYKRQQKKLNVSEDSKTIKNGKINGNKELINMKKNDSILSINSYINSPHSGFEFNILKYKEIDIALILTYISIKYYNNLYNHLYELNPTIKQKEPDKQHLMLLIDFSNKLSNFLIEESLSYDYLEDRVKIVEKIIKVLIELRNLNNFNDLLSVCLALYSISNKISKTYSRIDKNLESKLKEIQDLCLVNECYVNIRNEINKCIKEKKFYVPFIGIALKHINFYDEGTKYIGHNGLVCIEKIIITQKEIENLKNELKPLREKKITFRNSQEMNELRNVFYHLNPRDQDALSKLGDKLEPEFTLLAQPEKRKRKTNTESYINSNESFKNY